MEQTGNRNLLSLIIDVELEKRLLFVVEGKRCAQGVVFCCE